MNMDIRDGLICLMTIAHNNMCEMLYELLRGLKNPKTVKTRRKFTSQYSEQDHGRL